MYTLSPACLQLMTQALLNQGINLQALLSKADEGLLSALAEGSPVRLASVYPLLDHATALAQNPDIGLSAYAHAHPSTLGAQCYAVLSSPTLGAALQCMVDHHVLVTNGSQLLLEQTDTYVRLLGIETMTSGGNAPRTFLDMGHALILGLIHWLWPYKKVMPLEVAFSYPRPADTRQLQALFGSNLVFAAPHNSMTFSLDINRLALPTANPILHAQHQEYLRTCVQEALNGSLAARTRRTLAEQLALGFPCSLDSTARLLAISPRSLQNGLEREQLTYSALQDEARLKAAHGLLCHTARPLKYIAATLGFREPSSFHKACLRWFGMPPMRYRRYAGSAPTPP
ncbi:AraC-type DNA-binding protein [Pseudomonas cuatrocienegasensis]|uniref:AraC-type DNA-binding protein n=1 Tax=Pseudomonas cuatrocienegasensis TaxID=543360 RepID=A0ABY1BPS4_9PSED|nr:MULTISPECIES: AraC family transcriptional regulator [Pseudomonas]OEC32831.1 hypothetical protein A7D25_21925 [Pseudomonas sp. 21C1]SER32869.1 AraC-type DNA-binding protein [Pseudomonas cuatrocienegasensis]